MINKILSAISAGVIFNWLSLFFSYRKLPNIEIDRPIATGGFPFKAFEYPFPPMGHDWPPADSWPIFFLNLAVWLVVASFLFLLFRKKNINKRTAIAFVVSAVILSLLGIFYIMLKFD